MTKANPVAPRQGARKVARTWWRDNLAGEDSRARAARARLRRAHRWQDTLAEPVALVLARRLGGSDARQEAALALAVVLAHVGSDDKQPLMRAAGYCKPPLGADGDPPRLPRARFDRLLRSDTEELPQALVRLVRMLGGEANIGDLVDAMLSWPFDDGRARIQRRWAFDYFAASDSSPDASPGADVQTEASATASQEPLS